MMNKESFDEANENLNFGISILDSQHANLLRIINNLRMSCLKGKDNAHLRFIRAVYEAADYAQYHFSTEEKLLSLLEFPQYHDHKKEHNDFIWKILSWVKEFQEDQNHTPEDFVYFLNEWIHSHIEVSDRAYADYFLAMKHHGKLRLMLCDGQPVSANSA